MADNDRFVIQKITTNKKCFFREQDGINQHPRTRCLIDPQSYEYVFDSDCKKCEEGKTRAEYEDMIAESIYNCSVDSLSISWNKVKEETTLHNTKFYNNILKQAKAVVDRLFGGGK